jgi:hypothetical protein
MKKFLATAVVTGLIGGSAFAATNVVSSANIVGYVKTPMTSGQFQIIGSQFLAGSTNGVTLGSAFSGLTEESTLITWNGSGYAPYTYYIGYGWYDVGGAEANDVVIPSGSSFWVRNNGAATDVVLSGDVPMADSITNTLVEGFNLIANPYPVALKLSDIPTASLSEEDVLFAWNGSGYAPYTYYIGYGWYDVGGAEANTVEIPVGQGFWLRTAASGSLIFNKQY